MAQLSLFSQVSSFYAVVQMFVSVFVCRAGDERAGLRGGAGIECSPQCDKMGVKWNSRSEKGRGLGFGETRPSGSEGERKTKG